MHNHGDVKMGKTKAKVTESVSKEALQKWDERERCVPSSVLPTSWQWSEESTHFFLISRVIWQPSYKWLKGRWHGKQQNAALLLSIPTASHMWAVSEGSLEAGQGWRAVTPAHRAGRTAGWPEQLSGPWMEQPFNLGRSGTRPRWPPILVCSGLQSFPGCRTCSVEIGKVPGQSLSWSSSRGMGPCGFLERVISGPGSSAVCTCSPHPSPLPLHCNCVCKSQITYVLPYSRATFNPSHCISHLDS